MTRYRTGALRRGYPRNPEELRSSELLKAWWYYSIELLPGIMTDGQYRPELPMIPRIMLRRCDVAGMSCLDIGTMEGLVPVLLSKRGAREVLAVDYSDHCLGKLAAVQHYHGVEFEYRSVGLMYRLHEQLGPRGFDLVNCSGILYHVFSPLTLLAAVRPLVKRGGLVLASTSVTLDSGYAMDFNAAGRMQADVNTFWYPSARLFDYLLRYLRLAPIDCVFLSHSQVGDEFSLDKPSGYISVMCRAIDEAARDPWMRGSARGGWDYHGLSDWELADGQPESAIAYRAPAGGEGIDVHAAIESTPAIPLPATEDDSHTLRLSATG
jgi:SAM-dependent methyltransferase